MLDLVATDTEVGGLVLAVFFVEESLLAIPARGDGVTDEHDLRFALLSDGDERFMGIGEASLDLAGLTVELRGGDVGLLRRQLHGRSGSLLRGVFFGFLSDDGGRGEQGKPEE